MSKKKKTNRKTKKTQLTLEFFITFLIALMVIVFRVQYDEANQNIVQTGANVNKITAEESQNVVLDEGITAYLQPS